MDLQHLHRRSSRCRSLDRPPKRETGSGVGCGEMAEFSPVSVFSSGSRGRYQPREMSCWAHFGPGCNRSGRGLPPSLPDDERSRYQLLAYRLGGGENFIE